MDPGSSAPSRPHPRSPADRFACTHPLRRTRTLPTLGRALGAHPARPGPRSAQEEPGTAGPCTRLELWALEAQGLFPAARPALLRDLAVLLLWDGAALRAVPVGTGCLPQLSGHACWGSPWPLSLPSLEGLAVPRPPSAPQRAQSIDHPTPSSTLGEPVPPALPAPSS